MPTDHRHLASRAGEVRRERFGDDGDGVAALAQAMAIPAQTLENFERGVAVPDWVLLSFLVHTGAEPQWLLTGEGPRYRERPAEEGRHASR